MGDKQGSTIPYDIDCRSTSLDKTAGAAFVAAGRMSQLYGVDGRIIGGLRPHPGFKKIRSLGLLTPTNVDTGAATISGYNWTAASNQIVKDTGTISGSWAAGDLIEVTAGTNVTPGLYYVTIFGSDNLNVDRSINQDYGNLADHSVVGARMQRAAFSSVSEFYDIIGFSLQIKGNVAVHGFVCRAKGTISGSTRYQTWIEWYDSVAATWKSTVLEQSTGTTAYGSLDPNTRMCVVPSGRLLYVFREGWEPIAVFASSTASATTLAITYDTGPGAAPGLVRQGDSYRVGKEQVSTLHEVRPDYYGSTSSAGYFTSSVAPDVLGTGTAGRSADGTGAWYTAAPSKYASVAAWSSTVKNIIDTGRGLIKGNYNFAYQYYDERTGRLSALSDIAPQNAARFGADADDFFVFELIYDSVKWTHARIYRTVNSDSAGGTTVNSLLLLEDTIRLSEYTSTTSDGTGYDGTKATIYASNPTSNSSYTAASLASPYKRAIYYVSLEDKALVVKTLFNNEAFYDADMPTAGAACLYDSVMVCGRAKDGNTGDSGIGEIRWSVLSEKCVELFPPLNRFVPKNGTESPFLFMQLGDRVFGFSDNRIYVVFKSGSFITVRELYDGWGLVGHRAGGIVANELYGVTLSGVISLNAAGDMANIRAFDYVMQTEWRNQLTNVQVVFDSVTKCLHIVRPPTSGNYEDHGEMCCLWITTTMATQLLHSVVVRSTQGIEPGGTSNASRAFFVTDGGVLLKPDETRAKTCPNSMLDTGSATMADCNRTIDTSTAPTYSANVMVVKVSSGTLTSDMVGCACTFTGESGLGGRTFRITAVNSGSRLLSLAVPSDLTASVQNGEAICINPMTVRVVGGPLPLHDEGGNSFGENNVFRRRRVRAVGARLMLSADYSSNPNGKWRGVVYKPDATGAMSRVAPTQNDETSYTSMVAGPSTNYAALQRAASILCPGVEVSCSGMDFTLLAIRAVCGIESAEREDYAT